MPEDIEQRVNKLRIKAAQRFNISPESCHIGHLALEGMLERPSAICQIDGATNTQESNISVATRSMRLASSMKNAGLKPGDPVIISGPNHLDLAIPFNACHFMGYSMCSIDPGVPPSDLKALYGNIQPKIVFCQKEHLDKNKEALEANRLDVEIIPFDDMETYIQKYKGTEIDYRPATDFNQSKTAAWLMLTSGSTGLPKVAIITFDTLMNGVIEWWRPTKQDVIHINLVMVSTQWLSSLIYFIAATIKPYIRLQCSQPLTPQLTVHMINTYKPTATAWTPYLLARFVQAPVKVADLSCFQHILVGGAPAEKHIIQEFKKICNSRLHLCYGMTELLAGVFEYDEDTTPFGSSGKPFMKYQYRLIDDEGHDVTEPHTNGELWIKGGDAFFKGYLNNPEETKQMLTEDGWLKTGDIFYRDENDYYYFVERKRLLIRYLTHWVSPIQLEQIIRQHPSVSEVCVVGLPNPMTMEYPVAAILKKNGNVVDPQEIFDLVKREMPETKHLHGGLFFVEGFPMTPSGKINRTKVTEMAKQSQRIFSLN